MRCTKTDLLYFGRHWGNSRSPALVNEYSKVPNRRADGNKWASLEKKITLPAFLLSKLINEQGGITWKIANRVERKSEKSKQACSSIRDFRVGFVDVSTKFRLIYNDQLVMSYLVTYSMSYFTPLLDLWNLNPFNTVVSKEGTIYEWFLLAQQ